MRENNYWLRKATSSRLSRRRFVGGAAVAGIGATGLALVGCGDDDDGNGDPTSAPAEDTATSAPGETPQPTATSAPVGLPDGGISTGIWLGGSQFDSIDVHRNFRDETSWVSNYVLNKIVRYSNPDAGEIEGDLAEEWETTDAQTFTFKIRQDVFWQDTALTNGRQLTAEDIRWHIERQAAGMLVDGTEAPFRFQSDYQGIDIQTPDDFTVVLKLPEPNGSFLHRLSAYFAVVPNRETTEQFEGDHNTLTEEAIPASGDFILKQLRANEDIKVERNPANFRKGQPHIDGWITPVDLFQDPTAARLAFEQKQIDFWSSPDASVTKSIIDDHEGQMAETLTGVANTVFLHLNTNKQFKDPRLVRAMNMAYDRRGALETFHQGLGQVSGPVTWLQEGFAVAPADLITREGYRVDRELEIKEARALWEAGNGASLGDVDIRVTDTWLGGRPETNSILIEMLNSALGVDQIKSTRCTYNDDIIPLLASGEFVNWMSWTSQVNSPDPRNDLHATYHSEGSQNWQHVNNPELDRLTAAAKLTADPEESRQLVLDAQDIILDAGQFGNVTLYNYIFRQANWNYLHPNWKIAPSAGSPGNGYNLFAGHLVAANTYIDTTDPTYSDVVRDRTLG